MEQIRHLYSNRPLSTRSIFSSLMLLIPAGVLGNICITCISGKISLQCLLLGLQYKYMLATVLLGFVPWITKTARLLVWSRLLHSSCPVRGIFSIVLGTELGAAVSPTAIGGGYIKVGMLTRKGFSPGAAASVTTMGSIEDLCFFAAAVPIACLSAPGFTDAIHIRTPAAIGSVTASATAAVCCVAAVASGLIISGRLGWSEKFHAAVKKIFKIICDAYIDFRNVSVFMLKNGKLCFMINIGLTAVQWISRYMVVAAAAACFGIEIHPVKIFLLQWLISVLTICAPTPGGAVAAEAAFFSVYTPILPAGVIGAIMALWRFFTCYLQLSLGSILFSVFCGGELLKNRKV